MGKPLEELIPELIAALNKNTAALAAGKTTTGTGSAGTPASSTAAATKPKKTADEVKAIAMEVKDKVGETEAQALIKTHGGGKLAELLKKPAAFDKFVAAAEKAIAAAETAEEPEADAEDPDSGL